MGGSPGLVVRLGWRLGRMASAQARVKCTAERCFGLSVTIAMTALQHVPEWELGQDLPRRISDLEPTCRDGAVMPQFIRRDFTGSNPGLGQGHC